jgi:glycosyltransferase involved in cell wall biosynthesis
LIAEKGLYELISAWQHINHRGWRLVLAGTQMPATQDFIQSLSDDSSIEILGEVIPDEVFRLMHSCAIFTLPSHSEGFPNAVAEAMAAGAAVIATSVGAIPEMLADGCGILVPPGDATSLAAQLQALMNDGLMRSSLGDNARIRASDRFSFDAVVPQYIGTWKSVGCR